MHLRLAFKPENKCFLSNECINGKYLFGFRKRENGEKRNRARKAQWLNIVKNLLFCFNYGVHKITKAAGNVPLIFQSTLLTHNMACNLLHCESRIPN